jgi:ketosteroid isomerase-like protein
MNTMHELLLEKVAVRETIEAYCHHLDAKDFDKIADCFTDDCRARYNHEPGELIGGAAIAKFLTRVLSYGPTNHAVGNLVISVDGDQAHCCSQLIASLLHGDDVNGRVLVRAIRYTDRLRRVDGRWLISERLHEPLWQYDAVSQPLHLLGPPD